jgi:tryptophan-rich sensory protein
MIYDAAPFESKLMWPYIAWMAFAAMINTAYYLEFR